MIGQSVPYCGVPPLPAELLHRFNLDPVLILVLSACAVAHLVATPRSTSRILAATGWLIAAVAFISPLCALSVSLFSARVAQHMVLILLAAPLIAVSLPPPASRRHRIQPQWLTAGAFFVALWFWHMPVPYDATFTSSALYWLMHTTLFGSAILLWRELLQHPSDRTVEVLGIGALTSMQMGLLGAVLTFAGHPLFLWHLTTTQVWGLSPLRDQQLGGTLMWVPGIALFLFAALRSLSRLWTALNMEKPA
jgi:putative membrane protein